MRWRKIQQMTHKGNQTPEEKSSDKNDILYYPKELMSERSEPVFDKKGQRKMFFPFREMKGDDEYKKVLETINHVENENKFELRDTLLTKLNWNCKMRKKQNSNIQELSSKTYTNLIATSIKWIEKGTKAPTIIKRYVLK